MTVPKCFIALLPLLIVISKKLTFSIACIVVLLLTSNITKAQEPTLAPVDSTWALANGDTLMFHHDGTNEFVRSTGSRELRFKSGKRLYFFVPRRFINSSAFLSKDFNEVNNLPHSPRCLISFRLAPGYTSPEIYYSGVHYYDEKHKAEAPTLAKKTYSLKINFGEPDWYVMEVSARTTIKNKPLRQMLARVLVCSGDALPLPFDTLWEMHAPVSLPRTIDRVTSLLNADRQRLDLSLLVCDSLPDDKMQLLTYAMTDWNTHGITSGVVTARALEQFIPSMFTIKQGDTSLLGAVILSGENAEEICWAMLSSPMISASGFLPAAASVSIAPLRDDSGLHLALVFYRKRG